jgi:hypothetical protein
MDIMNEVWLVESTFAESGESFVTSAWSRREKAKEQADKNKLDACYKTATFYPMYIDFGED